MNNKTRGGGGGGGGGAVRFQLIQRAGGGAAVRIRLRAKYGQKRGLQPPKKNP